MRLDYNPKPRKSEALPGVFAFVLLTLVAILFSSALGFVAVVLAGY